MRKDLEKKHEEYQESVKKLNECNIELQKRVARCTYLKNKFLGFKNVNPEQAEAYVVRINAHKPSMQRLLEEIEELEHKVKTMPKVWIA
jgi:hypothetical protein